MQKKIIDGCMNIIKTNKDFDDIKLAEIRYGLEGLYLQIVKIIFLIILALLLNIFREFILFLLIYSIIRSTSFGLHATKSWICLVSSTIIFIGTPLLAKYIFIPNYIKLIIALLEIVLIYKNAPADTHKRPIVNPKRRLAYKYISTFIAIVFAYCAILINDIFVSNCFILAMVVQSFMIAPTIYKIFRLPYNNYLTYQSF